MRERAWVAILMAWIAGGIDADGYVSLSHLFTAHLSGNTAAFAASFGNGSWHEAIRRFVPIPIFVLGVIAGSVIVDVGRRRRLRSPLLPAFALEFALIFISLLVHLAQNPIKAQSVSFWTVAGTLSMAMGLQNATLSRVGNTVVRTTYITGMLTNFAECLARWSFWLHDRTWGRGPKRLCLALRVSARREDALNMSLYAGIWTGFAVGATMGGYAEALWHSMALTLPLAGIVVAAVSLSTSASSDK